MRLWKVHWVIPLKLAILEYGQNFPDVSGLDFPRCFSGGGTTCLMPSWSAVAVPVLQGRTWVLSWVTAKMHLENNFRFWQNPTLFVFQGVIQSRVLCIPSWDRVSFILFLWLKVPIKSFQKCHSPSTELSLCRRPTLLHCGSENIPKFPSTYPHWQTDGNRNTLLLCSCNSVSCSLSSS